MVLNELYAGVEVSDVELVGNVPAERYVLATLLYGTVKERHGKQQTFPLRRAAHVKLILSQAGVRSCQSGLYTLWRLIGKPD